MATKKSDFVGQLAAAYYAAEMTKHPRAPPASVVHGVETVVQSVLGAVLAAHAAGKLSLDDQTVSGLMTAIAPYMEAAATAPAKRAPRKSIVAAAVEALTGSGDDGSAAPTKKPAKSAAKPGVKGKSAAKPATKAGK